MEIVSVKSGVGEVLGTPQSSATPSTFQQQHHDLRACLQHHQESDRGEEEEEFEEEDARMETEEDPGDDDLFSATTGDRTCADDDSADDQMADDQMDLDESAARTSSSFLEDELEEDEEEEEDSNSRVFPSAPNFSLATSKVTGGGGGGPRNNGGPRNKRKNFQPRNIVYFPDSDEEDIDGEEAAGGEGGESDIPLDLSEAPIRRSLLPRRHLEDNASVMGFEDANLPPSTSSLEGTSFAEQTMRMRRFLDLYGLQQDTLASGGPTAASLLSETLLESLKANGDIYRGESGSNSDKDRSQEPLTSPRTPQRDPGQEESISGQEGSSRNSHLSLESAQHQALHARLLGERNFSTLLTLAALQDGANAGAGVPLPPTLDPNKSLPTTPTTPTSTAVTPGLANLSLQNGTSTPPTMVPSMGGVREHMSKQSMDYSRYVKRYQSSLECGSPTCRELNHREHFHCLDCNSKVFSKKEEMIRHFKWHKKRDESLQHGFMRYSPTDDCSDRFSNCSHNRKQTHYHCLKESCDKVYISTSDVQMHANYHRKDSAIMQEGFQRFRASEDCNHMGCSFSGQRTTHFHCIRGNCNFTFKNKADMEKHKTYHIKDEQLTKDGFKKFMKQEDCGYDGCKLSKVANHIHCIRPDCSYVLHSSGQIFAHKRKHERQEHEKAYRKYKLAQTMLGVSEPHPALNPLLHEALRPLGGLAGPMIGRFGGGNEEPSSPLGGGGGPQGPTLLPTPPGLPRPGHPPFLMGGFPPPSLVDGQHPLARLLGVPPPAAHSLFPGGPASTNSTPTSSSGPASPVDLTIGISGSEDREWERFVRCYARDETCGGTCELVGLEHWHCEECEALFHTRDSAKEHGRVHEQQVAITEENYTRVVPGDSSRVCPTDCQTQDQAEHFHCNWDGCGEAILVSEDKPFRRLEHFRIHDFARRLPTGVVPGMGVGVASVTSVDAMFKRKRGRPPKNRIIEVWNEYLPVSSSHDSPQAIFTSFKLPKSSPPPSSLPSSSVPSSPLLGIIPSGVGPLSHLAHMSRDLSSSVPGIPSGTPAGLVLPPPLPLSSNKGTNMLPLNKPVLINPPQPQLEQVDGFYVWNEGSLCSDQLCPHIGRRHFHCTHPRCIYATVSADTLSTHAYELHENQPIAEGFISFDRFVNCRMSTCQSNNVSKHYHCTKCGFSFVRYEVMEAHIEKHQQEEDDHTTHSLGPLSPIYLQKPRSDSPMDTPTGSNTSASAEGPETPSKSQPLIPVVKSSGIFYPLSPFPSASQGTTRTTTSTTSSEPGALITPIPPSSRPSVLPTFTLPVSGCLSITATRRSPGPPPSYSPLTQESMEHEEMDDPKRKNNPSSMSVIESPEHSSRQGHINDSPVASALLSPTAERTTPSLLSEYANSTHHMQYGQDMCGRPFCKLKKKDHFHCHICNQAFSEQEKLRPHMMKHVSGFGTQMNSSEVDADDSDVDIKQESSLETQEDKKFASDEMVREQTPFSAASSLSSHISTPIPGLSSSTSPRASLNCHQPPHQFPNPLIYSQAASFHGLPNPFGPHFGISGMFPGSLPRLLPHGPWPGVHPALAAMAHPHLMLPQVRPNGELPHAPQTGGQCSVPNMSSVVGAGSSITVPGDRSPIIPNSLNTSPHLALLGKRLGPDDFNMQEAKKIRASHSIRMLKDEPVPEGYIRFRFNEDCQYAHCGYREHQTHFHCMRKDCGYSFCDKTRFVQHTARHERLDTLMGGDFHQFRSNVPCGRPECVYSSMIGQQQNKASHFHCLKCDFVCTDTNKVVAHRRQHQKRDSINAAGFEKFTPSQPCGVQSCSHNQKQTHYHCLKCQYSVLGLSQMSAHKFRHVE